MNVTDVSIPHESLLKHPQPAVFCHAAQTVRSWPALHKTSRTFLPCPSSEHLSVWPKPSLWASPNLWVHGSLPRAHFLAYGVGLTWFTVYLGISTQGNSPVFSRSTSKRGLFTQGNPHLALPWHDEWCGSCNPEAREGNHLAARSAGRRPGLQKNRKKTMRDEGLLLTLPTP